MQTTALFDLDVVAPAKAAPQRRAPLALGELPVSSVPAAYDRGHLYSPRTVSAEHVDHRPGDVFGPLPMPAYGPKAWRAWWDEASTATADYLGLMAGDEITIQHVGSTGPGTVLSTCRFGAVVRYALPPVEWRDEEHAEMYVTARNQFGHWYR
ncbi:hypothetical protein ACIP9H_33395 [Streptomyces sp. NPDC088732]|uniref:hypothetical protein n=1 Tax=Streptomyces sp. NPDC088732 TaxID=3365879 RepID=UPI0038031A7E